MMVLPISAAPALELRRKVELLQDARVYPQAPARIETVETHMSWVFLADHLAYKMKKPVRYDYLDFSTLAARERNCEEELRLNQALAPNVYLGVVPLAVESSGNARLEGTGVVIEWLVKMRRLPADRMLDHLIQVGQLQGPDLARLARVLVEFYRNAAALVVSGRAYRAQLEQMTALNRAVLSSPRYALSPRDVADIHGVLNEMLARDSAMFDRRAAARRIIEGHGDLRPEHVCLEERPVVFDRLEFKREFRVLDAVDELSYLAMECERLGAPSVGRILFDAYRSATGDDPPERLRYFYRAHRACVRARLAVLHIDEIEPAAAGKWSDVAQGYLDLARDYCRSL